MVGVEFRQPRPDVAAHVREAQVRVEAGDLGGAADGGGADYGAGGQGGEGGVGGCETGRHDEGVAGIGAWEDGAEGAGGGELGWHVCLLSVGCVS